ncbi:MAG: nucleic acid-binding protein [Planctomycetes bacterium RBG_13_60_9]|nr:MAG: nucleic acid-binding protein [Planctomycetes bacterium RBG_13_60_9]
MRRVFADSSYWIAVVKPKDQWSEIAHNASKSLGDAVLVTTDEVLTEFLTALSRGGPSLRPAAAKMVRAILGNANVRVIQQTREGFLKGVTRYEGREDKEYSLTDCISMNVMESQSLADVLTNDHHFEQEGFNVLIKRSG